LGEGKVDTGAQVPYQSHLHPCQKFAGRKTLYVIGVYWLIKGDFGIEKLPIPYKIADIANRIHSIV